MLSDEDSLESETDEIRDFIRNEHSKLRSAQAKAEFFSGIRFQARIDSVEQRIQVENRAIIRDGTIHPNLHFKMSNICFKAGFIEKDLALQITLREIFLSDYSAKADASKVACAYALESLKFPPE